MQSWSTGVLQGMDFVQEKANVRRKTKILMDILTAGKEIDHVISQHIDDIDEQMIELLDKRTKMASR